MLFFFTACKLKTRKERAKKTGEGANRRVPEEASVFNGGGE